MIKIQGAITALTGVSSTEKALISTLLGVSNPSSPSPSTPAPAPTNTKTALFFGDSITYGVGASSPDKAWISLISADTRINQGIPGSVLQNTAPTQANNGRDRYQTDVLGKGATDVYILYGLNDLLFNSPNFSASKFQTQLEEVLAGIIASGIPANRITVGSPPFVSSYSGAYPPYPYDAGSEFKHREYRDATALAAYHKGVKFADVYQYMHDHGGNSLTGNDGVHPNDAGEQIIATAMAAALVLTTAPTPTVTHRPQGASQNLALNKPATALSHLADNYSASKGNDGSQDWQSNFFYCSAAQGSNEFWQVDLGDRFFIEAIRIYPVPNYETMLNGLQIFLDNLFLGQIQGASPYATIQAGIEDVRLIKLQGASGYLTFVEVEVIGY